MKKSLLVVLLLCSIVLQAQEKDSISLDPAEIIYQVGVGELAGFGDISIKFIKVVADSRCPRNVTCIRAGEAKVLMGIYQNGKMVEEKEIMIPAKGTNIPLFSGENFLVQVFDLNPYPNVNDPIKDGEYFMDLVVGKISEENEQ